MNRLLLAVKAIQQLGLRPVGLLFIYRLGLASGFYRWTEKGVDEENHLGGDVFRIQKIFTLPPRETFLACLRKSDIERLRTEADEIVNGKVKLFGDDAVELKLKPEGQLSHWTAYETGKIKLDGDIKITWEPARFGWAFILARAFYICKESKYAHAFWRLTASFLEANPPYKGPHWMSGQEVALRLIGLTYAAQVFASAEITVPKQITALGKVIAVHAKRILPTLVYARAQNNNHLLSEAAGLITAGLILPHHPQANRWLWSGWKWFNYGLETQINDEGVYIQHSANYHRLMLQLALWVNLISQFQIQSSKKDFQKFELTDENLKRLDVATDWLLSLTDKKTGCCPNLGPNDGSYIQPLTVCPIDDYRPVLQASSMIFGGKILPVFGNGAWDEMGVWYGAKAPELEKQKPERKPKEGKTPHILRNKTSDSWGYLRIANFGSRPGHADQLHFDLWRQGLNITQDAGTFSYNSDPPWDNTLAKSEVHNTVTVNRNDQMMRAGKFLWLDWAQARVLNLAQEENGYLAQISAEQDGYKNMGIIHRRSVSARTDGSWYIEDELMPSNSIPQTGAKYSFRLHWLLCNAPWEWEIGTLTLFTKKGICTVEIHADKPEIQFQLVRGGELLVGEGEISPTWGWVSLTYGKKEPALSLSATVTSSIPVQFSTLICFHNY